MIMFSNLLKKKVLLLEKVFKKGSEFPKIYNMKHFYFFTGMKYLSI